MIKLSKILVKILSINWRHDMVFEQDLDFTNELNLFKKMVGDEIKKFKALFKSQKGIVTLVEFIARFIPSILFIILTSIAYNHKISALLVCGMPLFFVGVWAIINNVAVKRFGINA